MAKRASRDVEHAAVWRLLFISMTRVFNRVEGDVKKAVDLSLLDLGLLFALQHDGAQPMTRLARLYGVDPSVITYRIGRLERMRLAERNPGETDRRLIWATITTEGRERLRVGRSTMLASAQGHFFAHVDPGALPTLMRLFGAVAEAGGPDSELPPPPSIGSHSGRSRHRSSH